jgi:hypothetical protein
MLGVSLVLLTTLALKYHKAISFVQVNSITMNNPTYQVKLYGEKIIELQTAIELQPSKNFTKFWNFNA